MAARGWHRRLDLLLVAVAGVVVVHLSAGQMADFAASRARDPAIAKLYELEVAYVTKRGGLALELWRLHRGDLFGDPWIMTLDECVKRLDATEEEVLRVAGEVAADVHPRWFATEEYQRSPYREMHERRARGLPPMRRPGEP